LEEYGRAKARGAKIYGELLGYGASADGYHLTHPPEGAEGAGRAMLAALREAKLHPSQIDYVNAHATSTPAGDVEEARAISRILDPNRAKPVFVSSTKSMTGHMLGAAGATEAMLSLLALRDGKVPPTINLENLDPACAHPNLHIVAKAPVEAPMQFALSNSFGFGGTNGSLIFGKG